MRLYPVGGYENPGYGAWGVGLAVQFSVAMCLLLLAAGKHDGPPGTSFPEHRLQYTSSEFFNTMGGLHILAGSVTAVVVIVGYLVLPIVLLPLPLITILNWCLLIVTAGCCGKTLSELQSLQKLRLQHMRHPEMGPPRPMDYTEYWAFHNQASLMYVTSVSVAIIPAYLAGLIYSKDSTTGTRATTWFYVSLLTLICAMVVSLMKGLPKYSSIGIVWFVLWAALVGAVLLQGFCLYRVFAIVIAIIFALVAIYSLIIWVVAMASISHAKKFMLSWDQEPLINIPKLDDSEYSWLKVTALSNVGQYLVYEAVLSSCICLASIFSGLYAIYSVFTKKPPGLEKAKKEGDEEAPQQRDEVQGLKEEEPVNATAAQLSQET